MCAVCGIVDFEAPVDPGPLAAMCAVLRHRGPDDHATWHDRHAALGFQRLSIVDVRHGAQPTADESGSIRALLNGEIYNHKALRRALAARGHRFRSDSDAEVVPHLYEEYGDRFVEHLDGDFGIAIWDAARRTLTLARDRVGVKPLFYHVRGARLTFASEIKGIFASGACPPEIDPQGLSDCLFYGHTIAPGTFWRDVRDLEPGTVLTADADGIRSRRYFRVFQRVDPDAPLLTGRAAIEAFGERFTAAVAKRVPGEVDAGVALSGGLDSSAIAAVAARRCGAPLTTLSVRLSGAIHDETEMSRLVARWLRVPNVESETTGARVCELLPKSMWHFESPFWYGGVASPFLDLTALARDRGLKVAMSGDGSDELLAGYDFYRLMRLSSRLEALRLDALRPLVWRQATKWIGGFAVLLAVAGTVTLASTIGRLVALLYDTGDQYRLLADPDLIPDAVREGLRVTSSMPVVGRGVVGDVELDGRRLRAGDRVKVMTWYIDNSVGRFDLDLGYVARTRQLWFGGGSHFCLGAALTHAQLTRFLATLLAAGRPWEITRRRYRFNAFVPLYRRLDVRLR
ncbi:asparagine synthase (glutamine-hydrolyzing) [Nocardia xishanensis]|uniref:asparagine synthase (glutamine-hydrolyzing) n=1 Tax=Nocardia xishanensis TaxID=238964 RepID=UPI00082D50D5|nr:asparagine synthase (glutamine-hydrolyzing) [Nocardia xishanensis]